MLTPFLCKEMHIIGIVVGHPSVRMQANRIIFSLGKRGLNVVMGGIIGRSLLNKYVCSQQ